MLPRRGISQCVLADAAAIEHSVDVSAARVARRRRVIVKEDLRANRLVVGIRALPAPLPNVVYEVGRKAGKTGTSVIGALLPGDGNYAGGRLWDACVFLVLS